MCVLLRPVFSVDPHVTNSIANIIMFINMAFEHGWNAETTDRWTAPQTVAETVLQSPYGDVQQELSAATHDGHLEVLKFGVDTLTGTSIEAAYEHFEDESSAVVAGLSQLNSTEERHRYAAKQVSFMAIESLAPEAGATIKFNGCQMHGIRSFESSQERISLSLEQWVLPPEVLDYFPTLLITSHGKVWTESPEALDWFGGNGFARCMNNYTSLPQLQPILKEIESLSEKLTYSERIELCAVAFGIADAGVTHNQFVDCRERGGTVDMCRYREKMPEFCPAVEEPPVADEAELLPDDETPMGNPRENGMARPTEEDEEDFSDVQPPGKGFQLQEEY